jgi:hypothetical protein
MTTPRDDGDLIVPLRLQPVVARKDGWRGRSSSLIGAGLVAFVVVAIVLGNAFDDGRPARPAPVAIATAPPSAATSRPSRPPTPVPEPLATPLPRLEVFGGQIPTEEPLVYANGLERLDLATGALVSLVPRLDYPALPLPNGEVVCACVARDVAANAGTRSSVLRFGRYEASGTPIVERDLLSFDGVVDVPDMTEGIGISAALGADSRLLYVLVAERRPPEWVVSLHVVDAATGALRRSVDIGREPVDLVEAHVAPSSSATPTPTPIGATRDGIYLWPGTVAPALDGESAYVSVERARVQGDNWESITLEWMVDLAGEPAGAPLALAPALRPGDWCVNQPAYLDADQLVQVCASFSASSGEGDFYVRRIASDGTSLDEIPVVPSLFNAEMPVSVVLDRSRHAVFIWNNRDHALVRVDVDDGEVWGAAVEASMLPDRGQPAGGQGRGRGFIGGDPGLVRSADGQRLYALGAAAVAGDGTGVPTGIWVFDADTMTLVDHWDPRAFLSSLATSADGRFVYAAGAAGVDVEGRENAWPASVTVYDAETGEVQVVYGAVSPDAWVSFVTLP